MNFNNLIRNTKIQIILLILFAALPRLFFMNLIEFKYDEALSAFGTYLFYQQPNLPQVGMLASTGMYNFPLFNYLLILIGLFSRNPQYLTFVIALINVIAIILFYRFNKEIFGKSVAFISAITLAVSPWAIVFSRKIWAQDLILIFAVPFYYLLFTLIRSKHTKHLILLSFLLFILIQLHASGIFLALTVIILLVIFKININLRKIFLGSTLALIFALPYIFFETLSTPFCRDCLAFFDYQKSIRFFDFWNFLRPYQILNGSYFQFILGNDYNKFINFNPLIVPIIFLFTAEFLVIFGGILYFFLQKKKDYLFLPLILLIISFLFFLTRTPSYIHYYVIILPVVATFYALSFYAFYELKKNRVYKAGIILLFLLFFISKFFFISQFFQFISQNPHISGDYGPVFKYTINLVNQNLKQYVLLPQYEEIKQYSYVFINTPVFHQKLADYFINRNYPTYAIYEYQKALETNDKDVYSRANLAYLYIQSGNIEEAKKEIDLLSTKDPTVSAKLQSILDDMKNISN